MKLALINIHIARLVFSNSLATALLSYDNMGKGNAKWWLVWCGVVKFTNDAGLSDASMASLSLVCASVCYIEIKMINWKVVRRPKVPKHYIKNNRLKFIKINTIKSDNILSQLSNSCLITTYYSYSHLLVF